jgi:gluconolactonase
VGGAKDGGPDAPSDASPGRDASDAAAGGRTPAGSPCVPGMTYGNPLPANPMAMMVKSGFSFLEGPVWIASQNALYFSDFTLSAPTGSPGKIQKYTPATNTFEEWATMPATNGLAVDERGSFVAASQQLQRLIRFDPATKAQTNVMGGDMYNGQPFNCLNDVVVRGDGNIYFTDPNYQKGGRAGQPDTSYFRLSPAGVLTRIGARTQPNGISLSPDGQYLYVSSAEANGGGIKRHQVAADGSVMVPAMDVSPLPSDGMAIDCGGNLYLVANGTVTVVSPTGQQMGTIGGLPNGADFVTNAAFGGPDGKTLYVTSAMTLHRIVLNIPGLPN